MEPERIRSLLLDAFPGCAVAVEGGGGKYAVTIVGDAFEGLSAVKRQQAVYRVLDEHIASGAVHAVTMRLLTEAERSAAADARPSWTD